MKQVVLEVGERTTDYNKHQTQHSALRYKFQYSYGVVVRTVTDDRPTAKPDVYNSCRS